MRTTECAQIDVMTEPDMDVNLVATSDKRDVVKVIPDTPDSWSPWDDTPELNVTLPEVNGIPPEEYDVMAIRITAQKFVSVTVRVIKSDDTPIFSVSISFKSVR